MRTFVLAAAVTTALLAGCTADEPAPPPPSPHPEPAAAPRADGSSVLEQLREVDTCALYGGATELAGLPLTVVGPTSFLGCDGTVADPAGEVSVGVAVNYAPGQQDQDSWVRHHTFDGVAVTSASSRDAPGATPPDATVTWSCNHAARYPDGATLMVNASAPPDADACAIGAELTRLAIREFANRPPRGTSGFPTTVLSGADPCAAVERLRADHTVELDPANSSVSTCGFRVDAGPVMTVSFGYQDPTLLQYSPDRFDVADHQVSADRAAGVFDVVVGPQFQVADETLVPVVSVVDDPAAGTQRVDPVLRAVADEY